MSPVFRWTRAAGALLGAVLVVPVLSQAQERKAMSVDVKPFGKTGEGTPVEIYALKSGAGIEVRIITYGAAIQSILAPDKNGKPADVTLGFDTLDGYLAPSNPYFGCIVGRYGNRIAKRHVHARRQDLHARQEQRPERPARRPQGLRQGSVEGQAGRAAGRRSASS